MNTIRLTAIAIASLLLVGCADLAPVRVRALPLPDGERPPMNLPTQMRQRNWVSSENEGSCVHASMISVLRWHNQERLANWWRQNFAGGENEIEIERKLQAAGVPFISRHNGDPEILDWASRTRHGCILWWKPSHCCTFCGWIKGSDGRIYGVIMDNNWPERLELTERSQLIRLWNGYGGFALAPLLPPATPYSSPEFETY